MTSFGTLRIGDVEREILALLKQMLPNTKLKDFEESSNREIRGIIPPRDGIAYTCEYLMKMSSLDDIKVEQYWDKDGNCIGFGYKGQKYMFDRERVPKHSELAKYLEQYPDAKLIQNKFGWSTVLPEDAYPELRFTFQRTRLWDKDGRPGPGIKGMQKEL